MNERAHARLAARGGRVFAREEKILAIPGFDAPVVPEERAKGVVAAESALVEKGLPIHRPLAIHVMLPILPRTGGGEENPRGVLR